MEEHVNRINSLRVDRSEPVNGIQKKFSKFHLVFFVSERRHTDGNGDRGGFKRFKRDNVGAAVGTTGFRGEQAVDVGKERDRRGSRAGTDLHCWNGNLYRSFLNANQKSLDESDGIHHHDLVGKLFRSSP